MAHESGKAERFPTPEELAGRELRRLRAERKWSQEDVARRMSIYDFDWHQTTVGRTETASRPLRLNEAVALAALFDVPLTQLLAPAAALPISDLDEEIRTAEEARAQASDLAAQMRPRIDAIQAALDEYSGYYRKATSAVERVDEHLKVLRMIRRIVESGNQLPPSLIAQLAGIHEIVRMPGLAEAVRAQERPAAGTEAGQ